MQYKLSENQYVHGGTQKDYYSEQDVEDCNCLLCGSGEKVKLFTERGHIGIVQCAKCGLIYTSPRPKQAEENYFGDATIFYEEARWIFKGTKPHHRDKNYEYELGEIKKLKPAGKLLDIGTNMGFFLRKAKEAGYQVEGVEPSPALSKIASSEFGLKIKNAFFKAEDFPSASFDLVTLVDVFEHVTAPTEMLADVKKVLKDDGLICIKVPNGLYNKLKLRLARMAGREAKHDLFDACEHVAHYSKDTMNKLAGQVGLKVVKVIVPMPINPPVWANLVGHYYQYPSPFILDWKRIIARKIFYLIGKTENALGMKTNFAPDLMFFLKKA